MHRSLENNDYDVARSARNWFKLSALYPRSTLTTGRSFAIEFSKAAYVQILFLLNGNGPCILQRDCNIKLYSLICNIAS